MIFLNINIYKEMPKTKNWRCKKTQNFEHSLPNSEPKGRLRSEAQEKPDGQNKLILCSLAELQKND
jgi:hypothetical protein|tara:strand:+ start:87 stop:284 length:198 start_codon:yes stop_codon:yes gene_type:complete